MADIFDDAWDEMQAEKAATSAPAAPTLDWTPDPMVYSQDDVAKINTPRRKALAQMYQQTSRFRGEGNGPYHDMTLEMDKYLGANPNARLGDAITDLEQQGYVHPEELPVDLKESYTLLRDTTRNVASEADAQEKRGWVSKGVKGVTNIASAVGNLAKLSVSNSPEAAPTETKYLEGVKSDNLREQAFQLRNRYNSSAPGPKSADAEAAGQIADNLEQMAKAVDDYKESGSVTGFRAALNAYYMGMLRLSSEGLAKLNIGKAQENAEWFQPKTPDQQATGGVGDLAAFVTPGSVARTVFKGVETATEKQLAKVGGEKLGKTLLGSVAKDFITQSPAMVGTTMLTPQEGILDKPLGQAVKDQVMAGVESAPEAALWILGFSGIGKLVRGLKTGSIKREAAVWTVKDQMGIKDPKTAEALVDLIQQKKYAEAAGLVRSYREPKSVEVKPAGVTTEKPVAIPDITQPAEAQPSARKPDIFDEIAPDPVKADIEATDAAITQHTGAKTPQQLLAHYQDKYPELRGVTIGGWEATPESGALKDAGVARVVRQDGAFSPKESQIHLSKDASLTTTRHEIEHFLDAIHGAKEAPGKFTRYGHDTFPQEYLAKLQGRVKVGPAKEPIPEPAPKAPSPVVAESAGKQPWEMTKDEFIAAGSPGTPGWYAFKQRYSNDAEFGRAYVVADAIRDGRVVPEAILREFKDSPAVSKALSELNSAKDAPVEPSVTRVTGTNAPESVPGTIDTGTKVDVGDLANSEQGFIDVGKIGGAAKSVGRAVYRQGEKAVNFFTGSMAHAASKTPAGKGVVRGLDWAGNKRDSLAGKVDADAAKAYKGLTSKDRKWFDAIDSHGYPNWQRILEETPAGRLTAPNEATKASIAAYGKMRDITGAEAERVGMKRIGQGGQLIDFQRSKEGRMLREVMPDAQQAMINESGPLYEAIVNHWAKENGLEVKAAKEAIHEWMGPESVRTVGSLEKVRLLKNAPAYVPLGNTWVQVLNTHPYLSIVGAAKKQAGRIYFVEKFGQNIGGKITEIERLRARHQQAGGDTQAFDDMLAVWNYRPYARVFKNPRNPLARTVKIVDSVISAEQTSNSAIPNLFQPLMLGYKVGFISLARTLGRVIRHPLATADTISMMGGINKSVMDWSIQKGQIPEDVWKIVKGVFSRGNLTHIVNQGNNIITGDAFRALAEKLRLHGLRAGDARDLKQLLLTNAEIAAIKAGKMTDAIRDKIVQNGIKKMQFNTQEPHRNSKFLNIPWVNGLFAYNRYLIGTAKLTADIFDDVYYAAKKGVPLVERLASARKLVMFMIGMQGAGSGSMALRNLWNTGHLTKEGDDFWPWVGKAMLEVGFLGPVQRMNDVYQYGKGSAKEMAVMVSPKIKYIVHAIGLLTGTDRNSNLPLDTQLNEFSKSEIPAYRSFARWMEKASYPRMTEYTSVRAQVRVFQTQTLKQEPYSGDSKVDPDMYPIRQAFRRFDWETAEIEVDKYLKAQEAKGVDMKKAILKLRASISATRPINLSRPKMQQFLESLPEEKRSKAEEVQEEYEEKMHELLG